MSESPEEQPSTGVLGRIGSWFSPWRGWTPKTPTENESPTSDQTLKTEGGEGSEESVRLHREEEKDQKSNPNPVGLSRDIFPCEEEVATQSAHSDGSVVCSIGTAEGDPRGEELVGSRKKRIGQGKEREESSSGASASGNPEKNASHLTHHSSSSEQGVVWDSAHRQTQAQREAQVQTGRRLHVYLEETSVIQCGQDTCAGQEVVRTKVLESLQVLPKAKSSPSLHSIESLSSTSAENKRTNVSPAVGTESYSSALEGVPLKSHKDSPPEPDNEQTEADSMGRKNAARRKSKKNCQGDGGNSSQEKMPPNAEPVPEEFLTSENSVTSPQGKSPNSHMGESCVNSSSKRNPSSQASPETGERNTSCPDTVKQLENIKGSNSVVGATVACVVDGAAAMEDDDSLYKVERKTETPESKRRSIKVSHSEVKIFTKNVPLNRSQSPAGNKLGLKTIDEAKDKPKTEADSRQHNLNKADEEPKAVPGRIADKISLFERNAGGVNKENFQAPRSADVSPARNATEKLKANLLLSEQRSRSAERYDEARSSSVSPARERPLTIKERARNFTQASLTNDRAGLPAKSAKKGMSQKSTSYGAVAASKELDNQGKLDAKELIQANAVAERTLKPDGRDTTALGGKCAKEQPADSKAEDTVASNVELNISQQSKGPSRAGSRSKRRKSKEPTSPASPNSESKPESSTRKQEQGDDTEETSSASKQLSDKFSLPSDIAQTKTSAEQDVFIEEPDMSDKQKKQQDHLFKRGNNDMPVNRQEPESSVSKDEPDTAACKSGTKTPIDMDPVILPQKEEKAGEHSLSFTQERKKEYTDSREAPASSPSPAVEQPIEKQERPVAQPKLDELSMPSEQKRKGRELTGPTEPPKDTILMNTILMNVAANKDVEKFQRVESDETNHTEKKDKETPHGHLLSDKNTKVKVPDSGKGVSGTEGVVATDNESKNTERKEKTQLVKNKNKLEAASEKSSSDLSAQAQLVGQQATTQKSVSQTNQEAVSGTESSVELSKGNIAANVPKKSTESLGTVTESVVTAVQPQPDSACVEKTKNSADDSCSHGVHDAELSSAKPITEATTAVEKVAVKASNDSPALITAQAESVREKDSSGKGHPLSSASQSVRSQAAVPGAGKVTVKSVSSEEGSHCAAAKNKESAGKAEQCPAPSTAAISTATVAAQVPEKTRNSPVGNGDISPQLQVHTVKKEPINVKLAQTPKAPTSPVANKLIPDSVQHSSMKKLNWPRGLSKDDSATRQDAPSSWLDVDLPKQKFKVPAPRLSSSGSESNLLDTSGDLDDDDFVEKIKNLCAPFSLPPRKHNPVRPPQPLFAMPAIKEDRFEKTFDPAEFKFGLRKNNKFTIDTIPSTLARLQNLEVKSGLKPARASLADRSLLLSSLDTHSRLRDKSPVKGEEDVKGEKDEQVKVKSRLEGSCVFSSLTSSVLRGKRNGFQAEGTNSGEVSLSEGPQQSPPPSPQPPPPSPTATAPLTEQNPAPSNREEAQAVEAVVSDSGPPLPSFNDIKLPDYLEKYLPREPAKPVQSKQGQEQVKPEVTGKMSPAGGGEADPAVKPGPKRPDTGSPSFPEIPPTTNPSLPELKQPPAQGMGNINKRTAKGFHKRPGKMVLFEKAEFSGQPYEVYRDVTDATSLQLSPLISVRVVRGCWVLYEKPDFQGRTIALEEGSIELTNMWSEPGPETDPQSSPPMLIGSIRLAVWDYSIPRIDLFTEPEGHGRITPYHDDTIETGSFGIPLSTASIQVHSGVWLVFSDPGFQGMLAVLETGVYPFPEAWGFPSPFVGSLRPLKMGGFKVENPSEVKAVVYEKSGFEGSCLEIDSDVFSFCENEGGISAEGAILDSKKLKPVGSLKIIGGLWVGYSEPGFEGQQHILEEGEYLDSRDWGGSEQLLSLRPILSDFLTPHLKMFSERDFGERGGHIDLTGPVINMDDTGYGMKTQSIDVSGGVWVVFEELGFCGEPYVLEKGLYGSPEDWGALQPRVSSAMPVVLDDLENTAKFKVQLFSEPGFQGSVLALEDSVPSVQDGFAVASCKVLAGSWLAFEGQDFAGRMYVLEVGSYSDLKAMGCVHASASILSLQTVGFEFSLPSITLFERSGLRGKRVILADGTVNLQLAGGCSRVQSVVVEGGMWVLYEGINYRGAQIFLKPGEVPDWRKFSSWLKIGSLRPLIQKQVHFRLRNRQTRLMMSVTGDLDNVKMMRIQEMAETDGIEQIWSYQGGHLHCKLLEECRLAPSGSVTMAGSRVGLTPEPDNQIHLWSITREGFVFYSPTPDLVLEVKGGHHYDKNQVILNTIDPNKQQQRWDVEII